MKRFAAVALAGLLFLAGCGDVDETHLPERYVELSETSKTKPTVSAPPVESIHESNEAPHSSVVTSFAPEEITYWYTAENVPEIVPRLNVEDGRTELELANVYSEGKLYTITASVGTSEGREILMLILTRDGRLRNTLGVEIPRGDSFVLLENAEDNSTYGFEALSNLREYDAPEYPDMIGFIFRESGGEAAVPEYARYFAVFGGKLSELPIYENDKKTAPRGSKLEPKSAGNVVQHLTVLKSGGEGYEIIKFEYKFDLENKRLTKRQVKFYGWENPISEQQNGGA